MIELAWRNALYYLELAFRHPLYVVLPTFLVFFAGVITISGIVRPYYSEGLLVMEFQQIPSSLVSPTVANDRLRFIDQRVLSRANLFALSERLNLYPDLPAATSKEWIAGMVRRNLTVRTTFSETGDSPAGSASVVIGFKHVQPEKTVEVVSALLQMVMDENRHLRTKRASEATRFLEREVSNLNERLARREVEWAGFLEQVRDAQPNRVPTMLIELQAREQDLTATEQARAAGQEEIKLLETQLRLSMEASRPAEQLKLQLGEVDIQLAEARTMYTDDHPRMRTLRQRAHELASAYEAATAEEAGANPYSATNSSPDLIVTTERLNQVKARQEGLGAMHKQLQEKLAELKLKIAQATDVEGKLTAITTERQTLTQSLDEMKGRLSTAMMGERLEFGESAPNSEIIEAPLMPTSPSGPRRLLMYGALLVASAGAGLGGLLTFDVLDRRVRGTFDLKTALPDHTLVMIPDWSLEPFNLRDELRDRGKELGRRLRMGVESLSIRRHSAR